VRDCYEEVHPFVCSFDMWSYYRTDYTNNWYQNYGNYYWEESAAQVHLQMDEWDCDYDGCNGYSFEDLAYGIEHMYWAMYGWDYDVECSYYGCWAYDLEWDYSPDYDGGWFEYWNYWFSAYEYYSEYADYDYGWYCDDWGCNGWSYEELEYYIEELFMMMDMWYDVECSYSGCTAYNPLVDSEGYYATWEELGEWYEDYYGGYYGDYVEDWYCNDWGCNDMSYEEIEYGIAFMYKDMYNWDFELECYASGCTEYWAPRDYYDEGTGGTHYGWEYWEELYYDYMEYWDDYYDYYGYNKETTASVRAETVLMKESQDTK